MQSRGYGRKHQGTTYQPRPGPRARRYSRNHTTTTSRTLVDISEMKFEEVQEVIKKARSGSAPGPSGITYKIYKMCPLLTRRLWRLLKVMWRKKEIPSAWLLAEGCFVPKEENSSTLDQFREILLLSIEGKIFWSIVVKWLTTFLVKNNYIDTSVQKGGISGYAGCIEHTAAITQLTEEAKKEKKDLAVVWLDCVPQCSQSTHLQSIGLLPCTTGDSKAHRTAPGRAKDEVYKWEDNKLAKIEKGILAGCTISVILFVAAMNILLSEAGKECRVPKRRKASDIHLVKPSWMT